VLVKAKMLMNQKQGNALTVHKATKWGNKPLINCIRQLRHRMCDVPTP